MRHVEHELGPRSEDAQTVVAPRRVADVSSCSIAVGAFARSKSGRLSGIENLPEPGDVRFEPIVISGVACSLFGLREFEQSRESSNRRCEQRFFETSACFSC